MDNAMEEPPAIDPISRQILARTNSQHRVPGSQYTSPPSQGLSTASEEPQSLNRQGTSLTESESLRRSDSLASNKGPKEKKKGFLSRILGNKNREEQPDPPDNVSELMDNREPGNHAEVFSQPVGLGYQPNYPAPQRYIRVKAQNRKRRDFDRLFLAQILSECAPRSRKGSVHEVDAKIHGINDRPVVPPPNSARLKNNAVWAAEVSKDGQYYAAAGQDKKLKVWRVISSDQDRESPLKGNEQDVILSAPVFGQELVREYEGHTAAILDLTWSKNNFLLSSSMDKTVRLYHISRPECLCAFKHNDFVTSISFHPRDDRFFLAGSLDSKIRLWSIPDKNVAYWAPVQDMVTAVAFTPDGKTAIAGTLSGICILYDTEGLKAHSQIHVRSNRGKNSKGSKITGIETIQISRPVGPPDVKILITSNDSRIRLYNLRDRSLEVKFRGNENNSSQIRASFSDDGKYVICGSEDKRVYVWPTGPVERQDPEKRPVEIFEAHTSTVTTALLLPTKSRRLLARSGDPIYDLCNPPPVRLLSRTDSVLSSRAPADNDECGSPAQSSSPYTDESPQYTARNSHTQGLIMVTGDYTGEIKVFRQDCAYQKRREGSWDTASFSRKMLGRSGSTTTKTSERSSTYRKSITLGDLRNPANRDNINDWRNAISVAKPPSAATSTSEVAPGDDYRSALQTERGRSASPQSRGRGKRGFARRFSLRHGSTPLANSSQPSKDDSQRSHTAQNSTADQHMLPGADRSTVSPNYHDVSDHSQRHTSSRTTKSTTPMQPPESNSIPNISLTNVSPVVSRDQVDTVKVTSDNELFLDGDHSFMAYDVQHNFLPMVTAQPRTPGPALSPGAGELERLESAVSMLSDERGSRDSVSNTTTPTEERSESHGGPGGLGITGINNVANSEGEELKCKRCGSESFLMVRHTIGTSLKCRRCGEEVS
ncbi:hypothetical protein LTR64_002519 [Lithohypha guttulata]|uniref:uncharacterized protein n=1 Tax=Lithohypha guttulata TaxID=1690604 RepID=UPI002DDFA043|nr:hypothetical protein LTR51_001255 [Lithohypha guttulata]